MQIARSVLSGHPSMTEALAARRFLTLTHLMRREEKAAWEHRYQVSRNDAQCTVYVSAVPPTLYSDPALKQFLDFLDGSMAYRKFDGLYRQVYKVKSTSDMMW